MTVADLAEDAYLAYRKYLEWHNYQGRPMPPWAEVGTHVRRAWMAAAYRVTQQCGVVIDPPPEESA